MEHAKETLDLAGLAKGPRGFNRDLNVVGCLRTMAQPLTKAYRNSTALAEALGVPILPIEIPYSTTARDAALDLQPILTYAPTNAVSTAYRALAGFLLGESVEATEIVEAVA
jgi:cellulose biosynthesis protein BcsQ